MINCVHFAGVIIVSFGKTVCLYRVQNLLNTHRSMYCTVLLSRSVLWIVSARLDNTITIQTSFHCGILLLYFAFTSILYTANYDDSWYTQRRNSKNWPRDSLLPTFCSAIYILITKASEMHYFSYLFYKVLYMFRTCPLSIIRSISTLYTRNRCWSC
jgi:hypothetical protein